jgi:hypothetical protein
VLQSARSSITRALATAQHLSAPVQRELLGAARLAFVHGVRLALVCSAALAVGGAVFAAAAIPSKQSAARARTRAGAGADSGEIGAVVTGEVVLEDAALEEGL